MQICTRLREKHVPMFYVKVVKLVTITIATPEICCVSSINALCSFIPET